MGNQRGGGGQAHHLEAAKCPGRSFSGRSPARSRQTAKRSRTAWCRCVRSPPAGQTAACRERVSKTASHSGHKRSCTASACRSSATKSPLPELVGHEARKAPAPGPASETAALDWLGKRHQGGFIKQGAQLLLRALQNGLLGERHAEKEQHTFMFMCTRYPPGLVLQKARITGHLIILLENFLDLLLVLPHFCQPFGLALIFRNSREAIQAALVLQAEGRLGPHTFRLEIEGTSSALFADFVRLLSLLYTCQVLVDSLCCQRC